MPSTDAVRYEVLDGHVARITLNRPEAANAVNPALTTALDAAIDALESDDDVRAAVLDAETAGQEHPVFCAGGDLKAIAAGEHPGLFTERGHFAGFVFRERTKPIVAAIDGLPVAGGCEIALACDLVVASARSSFALSEVRWNLIPGAGGVFRLPRAIGRAAALDMLLTAEPLSAERACQLGLVSRLVAPGDATDEAVRVARTIASRAPLAVRRVRELVLASQEAHDDEIKRRTLAAITEIYQSDDTREGLAAFAARRPPVWTGR